MSTIQVGTDSTAAPIHIADEHPQGQRSVLGQNLTTIARSGTAVAVYYRGQEGHSAGHFSLTTDLARRLSAANTTGERMQLLSSALQAWNAGQPEGRRITPFDANGNAARVLNAIGRLQTEDIRGMSDQQTIGIRLHAEDNAASSAGDIERITSRDGQPVAREPLTLREEATPSPRRAARPEAPRATASHRGAAPARDLFARGSDFLTHDHTAITVHSSAREISVRPNELAQLSAADLSSRCGVDAAEGQSLFDELHTAVEGLARQHRPGLATRSLAVTRESEGVFSSNSVTVPAAHPHHAAPASAPVSAATPATGLAALPPAMQERARALIAEASSLASSVDANASVQHNEIAGALEGLVALLQAGHDGPNAPLTAAGLDAGTEVVRRAHAALGR